LESGSDTARAVCYPTVAERVDSPAEITLYDRQHFLTYARLLEAERDNVDWRDGVRSILGRDPDKDPEQARLCWDSHLERARWISTVGFQQAVAQARGED
jgi:hypothetical protein